MLCVTFRVTKVNPCSSVSLSNPPVKTPQHQHDPVVNLSLTGSHILMWHILHNDGADESVCLSKGRTESPSSLGNSG